MTEVELVVFEELLGKNCRLEPGSLRGFLERVGIVEYEGQLASEDKIDRLLRLAAAPPGEQVAVLQLPPDNTLRRFYEEVLLKADGSASRLVALMRQHRGNDLARSRKPTQAWPPAAAGWGTELLLHLRSGGIAGEDLGPPTHRPAPHERIVWPVRLDLSRGLEAHFSESERQRFEAYQVLASRSDDSERKVLNIGLKVSALPAMRAWLRRNHGSPPPMLPSVFQLHLGNSRLRASLFCSSKSPLLPHFTRRFKAAALTSAPTADLLVEGPLLGEAKTFSAARVLNDPHQLGFDEVIKFANQAWTAIKSALLAAQNTTLVVSAV